MDINGFPDETDVIQKLEGVAPDVLTATLLGDIAPILASVIAEFQGPTARDGKGGTGRNFTPTVATYTFDGTGFPELQVPDIVPNTTLTVSAYGSPLTDVVLQSNYRGTGFNMLVRPQNSSTWAYNGLNSGVFPLGRQNITVAATWGYAATVPADVFEAIRSEVVSRLLVQGYVGIAGAGSSVKMVDYEVNTAAGVSVWPQSSPIAILHRVYMDCVGRYKDRGGWKIARQQRRMS